MDKIKSFVSEYGLMIALGLIIILFFITCGMNRDADKVQKEIKNLKADVEFIKDNLATKKDIENQMETVMLDFLIYEDELDKIINSAMIYSLNFDLQTPNINDVNVVSVHQILEMNENQKIRTAKRLGYKFSFEK